MNEEKISVIVPVYKVEQYLDRCIKSIVEQTYKNLEIIFVDDGSPDLCGQICDSWREKDNRIIVIHKKNEGLSSARNAALDIASGKYIGFVDSDDFIAPNMYMELYEEISSHNADMIFCRFQNFVSEAEIMADTIKKEVSVYSKKEAFYRLYSDDRDVMDVAWNKLYRREIFEELRYKAGIIYEDAALIHKIIDKCSLILKDENVLYYRQLREDNITKGAAKLKLHKKTDKLYFMKDRVERYQNIDDKILLGYMCADYYQNLIVQYTIIRKNTGNSVECKEIHDDFCVSYKVMRHKIKLDFVKQIKYRMFYYCKDLCYFLMLFDKKNI